MRRNNALSNLTIQTLSSSVSDLTGDSGSERDENGSVDSEFALHGSSDTASLDYFMELFFAEHFPQQLQQPKQEILEIILEEGEDKNQDEEHESSTPEILENKAEETKCMRISDEISKKHNTITQTVSNSEQKDKVGRVNEAFVDIKKTIERQCQLYKLKQNQFEGSIRRSKLPSVMFKAVTDANVFECMELTMSKDQMNLQIPNFYSLAQAYTNKNLVPLAIYDGTHRMIGFCMYELFNGLACINRLMLDEKYQKQGYGIAAIMELTKTLLENPLINVIGATFPPKNTAATHIFTSAGFEEWELLDKKIIGDMNKTFDGWKTLSTSTVKS